jgi:phytoene dehydrogenase-like protein
MLRRRTQTINNDYDAIVVGSGPNGLAGAITLAQAGRSVLVLEAEQNIGGGTRTEELTLPGFKHDVCAAVLSLAVSSPFLRTLPLVEYGVEWVHPPAPVAHPLDDGTAVVLERSVEETNENLGRDAAAYRRLFKPLVENWDRLSIEVLGPLQIPPRHPLLMGRFALSAFRSARNVAEHVFEGQRARALFAGLAGHAIQPLEHPLTAAFALMLGTSAHAVGWPMARGGSSTVAEALAGYLRSLGGEIVTGNRVESVKELPSHRAVLFDVTPRQLLRIAGDSLPPGYRRALERYRYGPGVFKIDWALEQPIPWKAHECMRAATVHLGGTFDEIAAAERAVWNGQYPDKPYVLVVQPTLFDPTRAPEGKHTAWAYCHVPNGSTFEMTGRIEAQIERFAPGFRDCVLARHVMPPAAMEQHNANYIGGDINGGVQDLGQMWTRPTFRLAPYSIPVKGWYLGSSSTPPGGGVHGMCGYYAARAALKE